MDKKALLNERAKIKKDYKTLETRLINDINTVGLEYINLYQYISLINILDTRMNKINYLIAINGL